MSGGTSTNKTIDKGKTLLVDGPASVTLTGGKAEVFGFALAEPRRIIIREGKRLPFTATENATFELALGKDADTHEIEGSTIPGTWETAYAKLREVARKPTVAMVIGSVDSGKSSFCTFLTNRLVSEQCRVAVLDEDVGQSDIGPPTTVAYAIITKPVTDLFSLKPQNVSFVGVTSPSEDTTKTIQATAALKTEIEKQTKADFVVVNTDGWTAGADAANFKGRLAEVIKPYVVFCLQRKGELSFLGNFRDAFASLRVVEVEASHVIRERDREKRKSLRELGFSKALDNSKLKVFPISHIKVERNGKNLLERPREYENLLVGLHSLERRFMGLGVIRDVDFTRKAVKIQTAVEEKPAIIMLCNVRLDAYLREIPKDPIVAA